MVGIIVVQRLTALRLSMCTAQETNRRLPTPQNRQEINPQLLSNFGAKTSCMQNAGQESGESEAETTMLDEMIMADIKVWEPIAWKLTWKLSDYEPI